MLELILLASLSPVNPISTPADSVQPCVWPNTCADRQDIRPAGTGGTSDTAGATQPVVAPALMELGRDRATAFSLRTAQVQPCVWPNECA